MSHEDQPCTILSEGNKRPLSKASRCTHHALATGAKGPPINIWHAVPKDAGGLHLFDGQGVLADILDLLQHALNGLQHQLTGVPVEHKHAHGQNGTDEERAQHVEQRVELAVPLQVQYRHRLVARPPITRPAPGTGRPAPHTRYSHCRCCTRCDELFSLFNAGCTCNQPLAAGV